MVSRHLGRRRIDAGEIVGVGRRDHQARSTGLPASHLHEYGNEQTRRHARCALRSDAARLTAQRCKKLGIRNLLALRGDPPRGEEYWVAADPEFQHAVDLVKYIRRKHGNHFCIGVAGYPEGHVDSEDKKTDVDYLKEKIDAGGDFVVTQLFYCLDRYLSWFAECQEKGELRRPYSAELRRRQRADPAWDHADPKLHSVQTDDCSLQVLRAGRRTRSAQADRSAWICSARSDARSTTISSSKTTACG